LSLEGSGKSGQISVCFMSDKSIRELNYRYLGKGAPTDVLAFEAGEKGGVFLADLAVSSDTALRNAKIYQTSPLYELYLYVAHGVLHLLGYNDSTARQTKIMQRKAAAIINSLNFNLCP